MRTKVEHNPNLVRNDVGAIINTDKAAAEAYKKRREIHLRQQVDNEVFRSSINKLNDEIVDIKNLLSSLIVKLENKV